MRPKKAISEMTAEECADEIVFRRFKSLLERARKKQVEADAATALVYRALEDMCIDADLISSEAENADNLQEAISCFIGYGEYNVTGIMKEVMGGGLWDGGKAMRPIDADFAKEQVKKSDLSNREKTALLLCLSSTPTITPPPNDPLTMEELREMDGEPVYLDLGDGAAAISEPIAGNSAKRYLQNIEAQS